MKWRARLRRIILWSAASISVLLAVAWIGSVWWHFSCTWSGQGHVNFQNGLVIVSNSKYKPFGKAGWFFHFQRMSTGMNWWFDWGSAGSEAELLIPLWAPLGISAAITALPWRQERIARRRAKQHACPACGYDRAGLKADAVCPECNASPSIPSTT